MRCSTSCIPAVVGNRSVRCRNAGAAVLRTPPWVVRVIIVAAVIGFPLALLFAWFYQITPQGLMREGDREACPHRRAPTRAGWTAGSSPRSASRSIERESAKAKAQ
jgi:hypothetical protein